MKNMRPLYSKTITTCLCSFLCFATSVFSQKEIKVNAYKCSEIVPVVTPVVVDSTDLKKKGFDDKKLLETSIDFDLVRQSKQLLKADTTSGVATLPYMGWDANFPSQRLALQLLSFTIDADRYCKVKLSISSTEMFEVYINNKKEKSKEIKQDSLSKAGAVELDLTLEPRQYEVIIKRMAAVKNFNESGIKTILTLNKADTQAQLKVSTGEKRRITINDIMEGNRIIDAKISASGKYFTASYEEVAEGGKRSTFTELRELKTNRLLYRFPSSFTPYWMPTSDRIYYWSAGASDQNFYIFDPATLEETLVCKNMKITSPTISPDEKYMLIHQQEEIPADKGALKRLLSPSDRAGSFRSRSVIYLYNFENKTFQQLSFGNRSTYATDISPDSKKVLFITRKEDLSKRLLNSTTLFLLTLSTMEADTLSNDRAISYASFSPDGKKILIEGNAEAFGGIGLNIGKNKIANTYDGQAFIMDLQSKEVSAISRDFNPSISSMLWSLFDGKIYLRAEDEDRIQLFTYDVKEKKYEKLDLKEDIIAGFRLAQTAPVCIYRGESAFNSYRLYSYDTKSKAVRMLADPYQEQLSELAPGKMEDWNFTSSDGTNIKGRYYLPPDFDPAKKYPMIVYYYGGTSPTSRTFESRYPLHVYAALGYVVYTLQPSGTTGFGQEFSARHVNAWGKYTADDIIRGTKEFCKTHAFVDDKKIACIGASYGGFMTQYLLTQTDIFAAAISHAGISALSSYWGEGFWGYSYSEVASAGSYPWNNPTLYVEQSPLFHADKINTPLLLLHGMADTNVPIGESIQMYNALKILGKEVEFVQVEGENHAITAYQKRIDWNKTIFAWFAKWLKDQPEWWKAMYEN